MWTLCVHYARNYLHCAVSQDIVVHHQNICIKYWKLIVYCWKELSANSNCMKVPIPLFWKIVLPVLCNIPEDRIRDNKSPYLRLTCITSSSCKRSTVTAFSPTPRRGLTPWPGHAACLRTLTPMCTPRVAQQSDTVSPALTICTGRHPLAG